MVVYTIVGLAVLAAVFAFIKYGFFVYTDRYVNAWAPNKDYLNMVGKVNKQKQLQRLKAPLRRCFSIIPEQSSEIHVINGKMVLVYFREQSVYVM